MRTHFKIFAKILIVYRKTRKEEYIFDILHRPSPGGVL